MRIQTSTIIASFVGLGLMASAAIHAATVCVDPGKPTCEATVQDGVNAAVGGDTVSIAKGEFLEGVVIPVGKDGLIIKGNAKGTVLDSAATGMPGIEVLSPGVSISNLTVRNADGNGIDIQAGADGVEITKVRIQKSNIDCIETEGHDTVIEKNTLIGCGYTAVEVINADDLVIRGNTIKHVDEGGIEVSGERAVIEKNKISIVEDGECIDVDGGNAEVVGNSMDNCDQFGVKVDGDAPYVAKNRVVGIGGYDIHCSGDCANGLVSGNRASDTGQDADGFVISADFNGLRVEKNRAERCNDRGFEVAGDGMITLANNLARDIGGDYGEACYRVDGNGGHLLEANSCDSTHSDGFQLQSGTGHIIRKNKVVDAFEDGIDVENGVTNVTVSDNKVSAGASGIEVGALATGNVRGNTATGGRVDYCDESAGGVTATGNKFDTSTAAPCASDVD